MSKVSMDSHGNSFEEIIREVGKSIQCERIYIFEKNTDNTYDCTLEWCENPKDARKESMQHLKYECVRYYYKYFAEKKNLVIKNMDDLREENPKLYLILSPQQLHSVMAVQLKYGDEDLGFMGIDNPPVDKIEDYEPVLELVAYLISNLIKSRQTIELLNKMGYQDRLTGCGTRYSLFHDVDQLEMGTELCIMAVYGIFAPQLIGIFTESPEVIATGSRVLRTIMWILPFVGAVSMSRMSFQAMGKPQYAFAITLVRQLVLYVPLLLALNSLFGFDGMIWAQPCTELIMMVVSVGLLYRVIRSSQAVNSQL